MKMRFFQINDFDEDLKIVIRQLFYKAKKNEKNLPNREEELNDFTAASAELDVSQDKPVIRITFSDPQDVAVFIEYLQTDQILALQQVPPNAIIIKGDDFLDILQKKNINFGNAVLYLDMKSIKYNFESTVEERKNKLTTSVVSAGSGTMQTNRRLGPKKTSLPETGSDVVAPNLAGIKKAGVKFTSSFLEKSGLAIDRSLAEPTSAKLPTMDMLGELTFGGMPLPNLVALQPLSSSPQQPPMLDSNRAAVQPSYSGLMVSRTNAHQATPSAAQGSQHPRVANYNTGRVHTRDIHQIEKIERAFKAYLERNNPKIFDIANEKITASYQNNSRNILVSVSRDVVIDFQNFLRTIHPSCSSAFNSTGCLVTDEQLTFLINRIDENFIAQKSRSSSYASSSYASAPDTSGVTPSPQCEIHPTPLFQDQGFLLEPMKFVQKLFNQYCQNRRYQSESIGYSVDLQPNPLLKLSFKNQAIFALFLEFLRYCESDEKVFFNQNTQSYRLEGWHLARLLHRGAINVLGEGKGYISCDQMNDGSFSQVFNNAYVPKVSVVQTIPVAAYQPAFFMQSPSPAPAPAPVVVVQQSPVIHHIETTVVHIDPKQEVRAACDTASAELNAFRTQYPRTGLSIHGPYHAEIKPLRECLESLDKGFKSNQVDDLNTVLDSLRDASLTVWMAIKDKNSIYDLTLNALQAHTQNILRVVHDVYQKLGIQSGVDAYLSKPRVSAPLIPRPGSG